MVGMARSQWSVVNLHPAGAQSSYGEGIANGQQVGYCFFPGGWQAGIWGGTAASFVSIAPPSTQSVGAATTGLKQVGSTGVLTTNQAAMWNGTAGSHVNLHPATASESWAYAISGNQQVGQALVNGKVRGSLWTGTAASWVDLTPTDAQAARINAVYNGQQGGSAIFTFVRQAGIWSGTAASFVNLHPTGSTESEVEEIHNGQQVGRAFFSGKHHAALWAGTAASFADLNPTGATESECFGVHSLVQAGRATISGVIRAGMWKGTSASWFDLHALLTADFNESTAYGVWIDATGATWIIGSGYNTTNNRREALLWKRVSPNDFMLTLNKSSVAGQNSVLGTITLFETFPTNTVFTTYDNSSLVTTPASVTVSSGQLSKNFQITTAAITSTVNTTIYATRAGFTRSQPLTLSPLIPTAVVCTPNPVTGGQQTTCRVVINGVAGPGGRVVSVFDDSAYTTMPSTVTVPAGATEASFTISTTAVSSIKYVVVTARVSAGEKTGNFRINP